MLFCIFCISLNIFNRIHFKIVKACIVLSTFSSSYSNRNSIGVVSKESTWHGMHHLQLGGEVAVKILFAGGVRYFYFGGEVVFLGGRAGGGGGVTKF